MGLPSSGVPTRRNLVLGNLGLSRRAASTNSPMPLSRNIRAMRTTTIGPSGSVVAENRLVFTPAPLINVNESLRTKPPLMSES